MTTATAPPKAPFETHVYVQHHPLAHAHMRAWAENYAWVDADAQAVAMHILKTYTDQPAWGARSPVVIRTVIEMIMNLDESGDSITDTKAVHKAVKRVLDSKQHPPIRRQMLLEALWASNHREHAIKHRQALNRALTQPDLIDYLSDYFVRFIQIEAAQPEYEDFDREADAERVKRKEGTAA